MGFRNGSLVFGVLLLLPACGSETARSPIDPGQSSTGSGSDAGTGGAGGGTCAATVACPGTMSGPWCVEQLPVDPNSSSLTGVWSDRADDVWVSGYTFTQSTAAIVTPASGFVFHWDGCAWSSSPLPSAEPGLNAIWGAAPNAIWAVGDHGTAVNWDGTYWSNAPVGADVKLISVSGSGPADVWTTGGSHWDGTQWRQVAGAAQLRDVWAVSPTEAWATAQLPTSHQIPDVAHWNGTVWTTTHVLDPATTGFSLFAVWGGPGVAWAVGEGEQILHFANGAWTGVQPGSGSSQGLVDVMQEGADVYAAGIELLHSASGGAFQPDHDVPRVTYQSVWLSSSQVWVVGDLDTIVHRAR